MDITLISAGLMSAIRAATYAIAGRNKLMRKFLAAAAIAALLIGAAWLHAHARYGRCTNTPDGRICHLIGY